MNAEPQKQLFTSVPGPCEELDKWWFQASFVLNLTGAPKLLFRLCKLEQH